MPKIWTIIEVIQMDFLLLGLVLVTVSFSAAILFSTKKKIKEEEEKRKELEGKLELRSQEKNKLEQGFKEAKQSILLLRQEKKKKEIKDKKTAKVAPKVSEEIYQKLELKYAEESLNFERKKEALEEEKLVLLKQLKEQDKEAEDFKKESITERQKQASLSIDYAQTKKKNEKLEKLHKDYKKSQEKFLLQLADYKKSVKVKDQDHEKVKKKLKQYNNFYASMLSQKNMLQERLENWEKALKILSCWVLKQEKVEIIEGKESMGELVSAALEKVGVESLVDDEFSLSQIKDNNVLRFEQR